MRFPLIIAALLAAGTKVFAAWDDPVMVTLIRPTMTSVPKEHANATVSQPAVSQARNAQYVITLVNSHTAPIETHHVVNRDKNLTAAPAALHDHAGVIEVGAAKIIVLPQGWAGNIAMAEKGYMTRDSNSLLEGSFVVQAGSRFPKITLDVSYVDGFTVPMTCICGTNVRLGCNLDLNRRCPARLQISEKACRNPSRELPIGEYESFMDACAALAYTFPTDDLASINGIDGCEDSIRCCIGTACQPHPHQEVCPDGNGNEMACKAMNESAISSRTSIR
ncbi:Osmotin, thaumatin-like protein [Xylariaceae sp. FL1272]|nr:Osmotin, thaumatin-like protein [Xylariaceae sp. FL1272]